MADSKSMMLERNQEVGRILQEARAVRALSITKCAESIGTSRRRYLAMEAGEAMIGIAELEVLMQFLEIPTERVWPGRITGQLSAPVYIEARPGELLHIVIQPQK